MIGTTPVESFLMEQLEESLTAAHLPSGSGGGSGSRLAVASCGCGSSCCGRGASFAWIFNSLLRQDLHNNQAQVSNFAYACSINKHGPMKVHSR